MSVHDRNHDPTDLDEAARDDDIGTRGDREDVVAIRRELEDLVGAAGTGSGEAAGRHAARDDPLARSTLDYGADDRPGAGSGLEDRTMDESARARSDAETGDYEGSSDE